YVRALSDGNQLIVAASYRAEPDVGLVFEFYFAEQDGIRRDPELAAGGRYHADAIKVVEGHQSLGLKRPLGPYPEWPFGTDTRSRRPRPRGRASRRTHR